MFICASLSVSGRGIAVITIIIITCLFIIISLQIWMSILDAIVKNGHYNATSSDFLIPNRHNIDIIATRSICLTFVKTKRVNKQAT